MPVREFSPRALKQARLRKGYTQDDLAHELRRNGLKTNGMQIGRWESGAHTPRAGVIPAIADALDCSMDALYGAGDEDDEEAALLRDLALLPEDLRLRVEAALARGRVLV